MNTRNVRGRRTITIATAAVSGLLIWTLAVPLLDIDLIVGSGERKVGPGAVATAAIIVGLAAVGLAELLARITSRPRRVWLITAGVLLVASLIGPLGAETAGAATTLVAMHLAVGATLILGIGGMLAPREQVPQNRVSGERVPGERAGR
jgi:hypothetical protein